jgi:hypothetical protein
MPSGTSLHMEDKVRTPINLNRVVAVLSAAALALPLILVHDSTNANTWVSDGFAASAAALGRLLQSPLMAEGWVMLGTALVLAMFRLRRKHQGVFKATRLLGTDADAAPHQPFTAVMGSPLFDTSEAVLANTRGT